MERAKERKKKSKTVLMKNVDKNTGARNQVKITQQLYSSHMQVFLPFCPKNLLRHIVKQINQQTNN